MKKIVVFILVVVLTLSVFSGCGIPLGVVSLSECSADGSSASPVLFIERGVGGPNYATLTVTVENGKRVKAGEYYRGISTMLSVEALDYDREEYGRAVFFASEADGDICVFDRFYSGDREYEYMILKGENKAEIPVGIGKTFTTLSKFNGLYYVFVFSTSAENITRYEELEYYVFDRELSMIKRGSFDVSEYEIHSATYQDISVAVLDETMLFSVRGGAGFAYLVCDMESGTSSLVQDDSGKKSIIASHDGFYALKLENSEIMLYSGEDNSLPTNSVKVKLLPSLDLSEVNGAVDLQTYMVDGKIYFYVNSYDNPFFAAVDVSSAELCEYWLFEKNADNLRTTDFKFMVLKNGEYYDLWQGAEN